MITKKKLNQRINSLKGDIDILKENMQILQRDSHKKDKDVWVLKNPPKFQYGDKVGKARVLKVEVVGDWYGNPYNYLCAWRYTVDNGSTLEEILEDSLIEKYTPKTKK